ncbi:MAG: glycosyltransferase family 4 protein [Ferroplasma sp.]
MKISVIGWEIPPIFSGGLGIHTINIFSIISRMANIRLYVPKMKGLYKKYPFDVEQVPLSINNNKTGEFTGSYYSAGKYFSENSFNNFNDMIYQYNKSVENIFKDDVDIIHCHDWITYEAGMYLKKKLGKPLVITVHSTEIDRSGNFYPQEYIMDIEKRAIKEADRIITVSGYTRDIVKQYYGGDESKMTVIYNGIDSNFINLAEKEYRKYNKVLYFGRVTTQKGPRFFIEASLKVLKYFPETVFIIGGTGDLIDEMKQLAKELHVEPNYIFTGFVSLKDKISYYKNADVFVLPAVSEPFGISVIEAMSTGTPSIISYTTGVGEGLGNVLKCDYWDTEMISDYIIAILKYKSLRETMGINGQIESRKFTWENAAIKTMEVYKSL